MVEEKRPGIDCAWEECDRTVDDGPLYRTTPRGMPGLFMCTEHARMVGAAQGGSARR
jgi:hypothetical protein